MTTIEAMFTGAAIVLAIDRAIDGRFYFAAAYAVCVFGFFMSAGR